MKQQAITSEGIVGQLMTIPMWMANAKGFNPEDKSPFVIMKVTKAPNQDGKVVPGIEASRNGVRHLFTAVEVTSAGVHFHIPKKEPRLHMVQTKNDKQGNHGWIICDGSGKWAVDGMVHTNKEDAESTIDNLKTEMALT